MIAMAPRTISFKMEPKLRDKARWAAERLLKQGLTEEEAAKAIADECRCSYANALNQVQWVKVYEFSRFSKK